MNRFKLLLALGSTVVLSACFGGSDEVEPTPPASAERVVPDSAYASASAYTQFVAAQPLDEQLAPLALGDKPAPVSETDTPVPVN